MKNIQVVGFDADDTLWINEPFFRNAEIEFCSIFEEYMPKDKANELLFDMEMKNLPLYGYGIKPFTLSLIEAGMKVTKGNLDPNHVSRLIDIGKEMLEAPVTLIEGIENTLKELSESYKLVMITKGDLFDQERKLEKSGLEKYFHHIDIVSDKNEKQYQKLVNRLDVRVNEFLMVGNSLKSDIIPVLNINGYACHIPFHTTWAHEMVDEDVIHPNLKSLSKATELLHIL